MPRTPLRRIAIAWPLAIGLLTVTVQAGACSSPTASTPATSPLKGNLILSGNTILTGIGQTTQLSVTNGAGAPVTSGVQWQTSSLGTATVSPSGLVTAANPGTTSISAVTPNAVGSLTVYVMPASGGATRVLSTCQSLASGTYVLTGDLTAAGAVCISASNVASIQIDCQGHAVPGISFTAVGGVTVTNCAITRSSSITNASGVTIATSAFTAPLAVTNSSNVTISDSSFLTAALYVIQMFGTTGGRLLRDTITDASSSASAAVLFQNGSNNQVTQCTITGTYNGTSTYNGTDDGILDINAVGDVFQANTIRNFYDAAVEGVDLVANLTVSDNKFSNIGVAAISSYWCTNWTNSVFRNNTVSTTPMLLYTDYFTGLAPCGATSIAGGFSNNQIVGNHFSNPTPNAISQLVAIEGPNGGATPVTGPIPRLVVSMSGLVTNNLIQGNDFRTSDGPFVTPLSGFIDGGGNVCGPLNPKVSNFACTGSSSTSALFRR